MERRKYVFSAERIATNEQLAAEIALHTAVSQGDLEERVPRLENRKRPPKLLEIVKRLARKA